MYMYPERDTRIGVEVCVCFKCGNRIYNGYPKRNGVEEQEEWEKKNAPTRWDRKDGLLSFAQ
jgi:hypothetical protein